MNVQTTGSEINALQEKLKEIEAEAQFKIDRIIDWRMKAKEPIREKIYELREKCNHDWVFDMGTAHGDYFICSICGDTRVD